MIRVCHMTSVHKTDDVRIFRKECISLAKNGYEVFLVGPGESRDESGVHVIGLGQLGKNRFERMTKGTKKVFCKAMELDCDIYHFHDPELLRYGLKLKKCGKKVVYDSHELYRELLKDKPYLPKFITNIIAKIYYNYEKNNLKKLDAIIFPCPINGNNPFEGLYQNFAYVNNVPLLDETYDKYNENIEKEENCVCYVGAISEDRGITQAIKAADKAGAKFLLGGIYHDQVYKENIEKMPEYRCTEYLGPLSRNEVINTLNKSRIGLSVILNVGQYGIANNLATKVYEYMALGIPVILTKTPYNEWAVNNYKFGIVVNSDDVGEISDAIKYLLDNPDKASKMGQNGRDAIENVFNWNIEEKNLLNLYDKI